MQSKKPPLPQKHERQEVVRVAEEETGEVEARKRSKRESGIDEARSIDLLNIRGAFTTQIWGINHRATSGRVQGDRIRYLLVSSMEEAATPGVPLPLWIYC